jgi:hypothetical protein
MTNKVFSYGVVGLLAVALLAGVGYILLNPTEAQSQGPTGGQGRDRSEVWQSGAGTADGIAAYGQGQSQGRGNRGGEGGSLYQGAYGSGWGEELSAEEIAGVLYMREEEKLARDVYLTLYEQWELPIFQNIANAEQTHMDAIETLVDRYGLDDPAAGNVVGEFTDPTLRSLYADLVATGSQSLNDALRVGATIEEIDILDLEEYLAQTDAGDIQRVYESLMKGSRNHLRSFVATLEQQTGETYEPQYLDREAYDDIVNTPMESGGYGRGGSRGDSQGQGRSEAGQAGNDAFTYGQGHGHGNAGAGAYDGSGRNLGAGQGRNETVRIVEWETLTGEVIIVDGEITIQTAEGQVLVGMGQSAYREGFALEVGDEITVLGFYEDGEFKAGTVENLTTGETIVLRDETGRPMWAGQGRLKNQG